MNRFSCLKKSIFLNIIRNDEFIFARSESLLNARGSRDLGDVVGVVKLEQFSDKAFISLSQCPTK